MRSLSALILWGMAALTSAFGEQSTKTDLVPGNFEFSLGFATGTTSGGGQGSVVTDPAVTPTLYKTTYFDLQFDARYYPWNYFGFELSGSAGSVTGYDQSSSPYYLWSTGSLAGGGLARLVWSSSILDWQSFFVGAGLNFTSVGFDGPHYSSPLPTSATRGSVSPEVGGYFKVGYTRYLLRYFFWQVDLGLEGLRSAVSSLSHDFDAVYGVVNWRVGVDF